VLPTKLPESPSFYLESSGSNNLLAPYVYRAEHLLAHILDSLPEVLKGFKDTFEMVGTSESGRCVSTLRRILSPVSSSAVPSSSFSSLVLQQESPTLIYSRVRVGVYDPRSLHLARETLPPADTPQKPPPRLATSSPASPP
jgi:hypothetical protein